MRDTFMFVELLNNTFSLFINNIFQSCKIILEYFCAHMRVYFCSHVHVTRALVLVNKTTQTELPHQIQPTTPRLIV
jgi:hypothetical protein